MIGTTIAALWIQVERNLTGANPVLGFTAAASCCSPLASSPSALRVSPTPSRAACGGRWSPCRTEHARCVGTAEDGHAEPRQQKRAPVEWPRCSASTEEVLAELRHHGVAPTDATDPQLVRDF